MDMSFDNTENEDNNSEYKFDIIERSNRQQQTCTLKSDFKGCVYVDPATKQRKYLSPLEQFLSEQDHIFSKQKNHQGIMSHNSERSSTASTMPDTARSFKDVSSVQENAPEI